jgi:hypothetical protein
MPYSICVIFDTNLLRMQETKMTEICANKRSTFKDHWFWPLACAVCAVNLMVLLLDGWQSPQIKEFGVLLDFAVVIPMLYLICYWRNGKQALIKATALACLGIWAAGHIVPNEHHAILNEVGLLRYIGLAVLIAIQVKIGIEIFRLAFRSESHTESDSAVKRKAEEEGIPPWVANLLARESRMWRKAWLAIRGLFRS